MALKLNPDDVRKLQDKQLANVIRKLNEGKTLTAREEAILAQARVDGADPATAPTAGYVAKWEELAAAVHVDRRTLTDFRKEFAVEIKKRGKELTRGDGRHVVAAWARLLQEKGVRGRGVNAQVADAERPPDDLPSKDVLDRRRLKLQIERDEFEFACRKEAMLKVSDINFALGHMLAQFRQSLDAMPARCAGQLGDLDVRNAVRELVRDNLQKIRKAKTEDEAMQIVELFVVRLMPEPDYHFRLGVIEKEVELTKRTLRDCLFMEPASPQADAKAAKAVAKTDEEEADDDAED